MIGGFDLIYKNQEIGNHTSSIYTTMLGCKNNREDNLKKLARSTAFRLAKEHLEKTKYKDQGSAKKIENKFNIKPNAKIDRPKIPKNSFNETKKKKVETEKAVSTNDIKTEKDIQVPHPRQDLARKR